MSRFRVVALWVGLAFSWGAGQDAPQAATVETTVWLEVEAEPGILISRLNPPVLELDNPFRPGDVLTAVMDGEPYTDDPEAYYARLNPVTWTLPVPQGTASGRYPAQIRATFALCSQTQGFCFTDEQTVSATVQVGKNATATLRLRQPER